MIKKFITCICLFIGNIKKKGGGGKHEQLLISNNFPDHMAIT